jgi:hypothetical protein
MSIVKGEGQVLTPQDFDAIRDAVMETPRGRWFLSEYASRLRSAETAGMLDSMRKLEHAVVSNHDALMSRLAQAIAREPASAPSSAPAPQADLAPKHMKFFKQDEDIFEPAPQAKIAAVPEAPKPEPKPEAPKGARVVIRRASETPAAEAPPAAPQDPQPAPAAEPTAAAPAPAPTAEAQPQAEAPPKRRIVIIRHKPGEEIDVPLQNEMAEAS